MSSTMRHIREGRRSSSTPYERPQTPRIDLHPNFRQNLIAIREQELLYHSTSNNLSAERCSPSADIVYFRPFLKSAICLFREGEVVVQVSAKTWALAFLEYDLEMIAINLSKAVFSQDELDARNRKEGSEDDEKLNCLDARKRAAIANAAIWVTNKNQDPWSYVFHPLEIPDYLMIQIKAGFLKFDKVVPQGPFLVDRIRQKNLDKGNVELHDTLMMNSSILSRPYASSGKLQLTSEDVFETLIGLDATGDTTATWIMMGANGLNAVQILKILTQVELEKKNRSEAFFDVVQVGEEEFHVLARRRHLGIPGMIRSQFRQLYRRYNNNKDPEDPQSTFRSFEDDETAAVLLLGIIRGIMYLERVAESEAFFEMTDTEKVEHASKFDPSNPEHNLFPPLEELTKIFELLRHKDGTERFGGRREEANVPDSSNAEHQLSEEQNITEVDANSGSITIARASDAADAQLQPIHHPVDIPQSSSSPSEIHLTTAAEELDLQRYALEGLSVRNEGEEVPHFVHSTGSIELSIIDLGPSMEYSVLGPVAENNVLLQTPTHMSGDGWIWNSSLANQNTPCNVEISTLGASFVPPTVGYGLSTVVPENTNNVVPSTSTISANIQVHGEPLTRKPITLRDQNVYDCETNNLYTSVVMDTHPNVQFRMSDLTEALKMMKKEASKLKTWDGKKPSRRPDPDSAAGKVMVKNMFDHEETKTMTINGRKKPNTSAKTTPISDDDRYSAIIDMVKVLRAIKDSKGELTLPSALESKPPGTETIIEVVDYIGEEIRTRAFIEGICPIAKKGQKPKK